MQPSAKLGTAKLDWWLIGRGSSWLTSATCTPCPTTRRLDWCKRKWCEAQQPKQCRRTTLAATKPIGPLRPRRLHRALRDQETAVVEVLPHGWLSAAVRIAELLWATAKLLQGVDHRDRLWQDQRGPSRPAIEDKSNVGPSANIPRSNGASPSAGTAKHKSSNSATRGESELRKQLLHVSNEMDKSEKARFELEERVKLFDHAARHRNEAMCEMEIYLEIYSNYNFDMYPQYVSTEVEYMRESIASAARIMSEQSEALHISWMKALPWGSWNLVVAMSLLRMEHDISFKKAKLHGNHTTLNPRMQNVTYKNNIMTQRRRQNNFGNNEKDFNKNVAITLPRRRRWTDEPSGDGIYHFKDSFQCGDADGEQWGSPGERPERRDDQGSRTN